MQRSQLSIGMYLALVFVSGVAVGGGGLHLYNASSVGAVSNTRKTPEQYRKEYSGEMQVRLRLEEAQVAKLQTILERTHEDYKKFREQTKPEMNRIQKEQVDAVNVILSDPQRLEYEKMRAEREARRKARGDRGDAF